MMSFGEYPGQNHRVVVADAEMAMYPVRGIT
jgi:hypothetical protein